MGQLSVFVNKVLFKLGLGLGEYKVRQGHASAYIKVGYFVSSGFFALS